MIEFDKILACSIKCLASKRNNACKPATRLFSGKMLMFAKDFFEKFYVRSN